MTRVGYGLERAVAGAIGCREEILLPGPPAARRRCRRTAPAADIAAGDSIYAKHIFLASHSGLAAPEIAIWIDLNAN